MWPQSRNYFRFASTARSHSGVLADFAPSWSFRSNHRPRLLPHGVEVQPLEHGEVNIRIERQIGNFMRRLCGDLLVTIFGMLVLLGVVTCLKTDIAIANILITTFGDRNIAR